MTSERTRTAVIFASLLALAFVIYSNVLKSPFIWDDKFLIDENHFIKSFRYLADIFTHQLYYTSAGSSNFYRPLQTLFLVFDYALWKENPVGYHVTNVLFHAGCAFLIYLIIHHVFAQRAVALMVSVMFLVHTANSTVVDYISSRADSQAALFMLASFLFFAYYLTSGGALVSTVVVSKKEQHKKKRSLTKTVMREAPPNQAWYIISLISFVMGLLSKEMAIITPVLLLVSVSIVIPEHKKRAWKALIPFFAILALYMILRMTVLNFPGPVKYASKPLVIRLLTFGESCMRLVGILFCPIEIHIEKAIPYSRGILQTSTALSLAGLAAVAYCAYWVRTRSLVCFFGIVWFFVTLLPMSGIIQINTTLADHWLYLPSAGFFLAVIGGTRDLLLRNASTRKVLTPVALTIYVFVIIILSAMTVKQNNIWAEPIAFYKTAIRYSPSSFRPHNEIGIIYMDRQMYDEAIVEFKDALALNPSFDQAYDNLGTAYDMKQDYENAIGAHKRALQINPRNIKVYNNLGNVYNKMGRYDDAIEAYKTALSLNPEYKAVYNNLGVIYYKKGMFAQAREYWQKTLQIDPRFDAARENLSILDEAARQGWAPPR